MNDELYIKIIELKRKLEPEGYIIKGIFGSYVRGQMNCNSDIDLLIELSEVFFNKYKGYNAVSRLDEIERYMSEYLQITVDTVIQNAMNPIAQKYIMRELIYV
jgi:predicted nucleotidyltransferase